MSSSKVYWIKLMTSTFDSESVMLLESMPEGDTIIVIWLRMQILAGKCNAGGFLVFGNDKPYSDEMLATVFRRPLNTTRLAIAAFLEFGMVEIINDVYFLPEWEIVQNISGLNKIREQTRLRVAHHRAKPEDVTPLVTQCNDTETNKKLEVELNGNTTNKVRELLSGTPLSSITDQEIFAICKQHDAEKLMLAADICAETWRRKHKDIDNPGGYLNSMCGPSLAVPKWFIPFEERLKRANAAQQRKKDAEEKKRALIELTEKETIARNKYWETLSTIKQEKYLSESREISSFLDLSPIAIIESAKLLAWDASQVK